MIVPISKKQLWAGRILSALPILFLLFDGVAKLFKPAVVVEATTRLGYSESIIVPLGVVLWGGLYLRDERLRALLPIRKDAGQ